VRIAFRLGLRGTVIAVCLLVLAVTAYGVAGDLGLLDPPAHARGRPARQAPPSSAAKADVPAGYLSLYRQGARRCPGLSWAVLAAVGKVESDHGRARLPGVRSGWNRAGAAGPMQFGVGVGRAGNAWARCLCARLRHRPLDPGAHHYRDRAGHRGRLPSWPHLEVAAPHGLAAAAPRPPRQRARRAGDRRLGG
jgi:hypothetical protein